MAEGCDITPETVATGSLREPNFALQGANMGLKRDDLALCAAVEPNPLASGRSGTQPVSHSCRSQRRETPDLAASSTPVVAESSAFRATDQPKPSASAASGRAPALSAGACVFMSVLTEREGQTWHPSSMTWRWHEPWCQPVDVPADEGGRWRDSHHPPSATALQRQQRVGVPEPRTGRVLTNQAIAKLLMTALVTARE